jgi:shikimate dehydrogenase
MSDPSPDPAQRRAKLAFVGVTTGGSSIMQLFPLWAELLGLDAEIVGYDLPLGAAPADYRACVEQLAGDESLAGALVTTHKAAIFDHAADLFTAIDPHAALCREISCIARRPEGVAAWAKDPITAGLALDHLLGADYFARRDAEAICFGAGGAGLAIAVRLLTQVDPPARVTLVDRDAHRLDLAREVVAELDGLEAKFTAVHHQDATENDALLVAAPAGSLIINATGMGKDLPGSPITDAAVFPHEAVAWDLNYRGELTFLEQAGAQVADRAVRASDGWRYFLHGWTEVIAEVFQLDLTPERFSAMAGIAARAAGREHVLSESRT